MTKKIFWALTIVFLLGLPYWGLEVIGQEGSTGTKSHSKIEKKVIKTGDGNIETTVFVEGTGGEDMLYFQEPATGVHISSPTFHFVSSEMAFEAKLVKGAPYSAEAVTETVKPLCDGNRIVQTNSTKIFRDSEGRTRREVNLKAIGTWVHSTEGIAPKTIMIYDPVAGVSYSLDTVNKIAYKRPAPTITTDETGVTTFKSHKLEVVTEVTEEATKHTGTAGTHVEKKIFVGAPESAIASAVMVGKSHAKQLSEPVKESLGKQMIEGIEAEGTRTTITIPVGDIGNEQPINIISERWYSPELQVVVMTKNTDPMMGVTTYKLSGITKGEQAKSLFEVPSDYTIKEGSQKINVKVVKKGTGTK